MQQLKGSIGNPLSVTIKGKQTSAESVTVFPPSGIIPFHGFTMYGMDLLPITSKVYDLDFSSKCLQSYPNEPWETELLSSYVTYLMDGMRGMRLFF